MSLDSESQAYCDLAPVIVDLLRRGVAPAEEQMMTTAAPPTQYRLDLSDEMNHLALLLARGLKQKSLVELRKLEEQFSKPIKLAPKPPTALKMKHCLAFMGFLYVEAIVEAAKQHQADRQPPEATE